MRSSDPREQARLELLEAARGRPLDSPGWGMLICTRGGSFVSQRDPRERVTVNKGTTLVAPHFWLAAERPELFKPADRRDTRAYNLHRGNLERARRDLERGGTATRRVSDQRRAGVLPRPRPAVGLRWPRPNRPALVLP